MYRVVLLAAFLASCAGIPVHLASENVRALEAPARQLASQPNSALLYLVTTRNPGAPISSLLINGERVVSGTQLNDYFYVFCLAPGSYEIEYRGEAIIPNKTEFLVAKYGEIYVRDFQQYALSAMFFRPDASILRAVEIDEARHLVAVRNIGPDSTYANSKYRCQSISS
jgi:hypothetical protein